LKILEKSLFGNRKDTTEEKLAWFEIGPDNFMIRTLKQAVAISVHTLERQVKNAEKDIKKAQQVFFN
jgi:hypothetical protein